MFTSLILGERGFGIHILSQMNLNKSAKCKVNNILSQIGFEQNQLSIRLITSHLK